MFPALHGTFGEDGTIQGLLELADLPYVGPGVLASSLSMDKEMLKRVCRERRAARRRVGYRLPRPTSTPARSVARLRFPMFVKPANLGSSVGISKVNDRAELETALEYAAQYDRKVIVERAIIGMELECSVMGNGRAQRLATVRSDSFEGVLRLRGQVPARQGEVPPPGTDLLRNRSKRCGGLRWNATGRSSAKEWRGSTFCSKRRRDRFTSTRSIRFPASPRSSMFPKMWQHDGIAYGAAFGPSDRVGARTPRLTKGDALHTLRCSRC